MDQQDRDCGDLLIQIAAVRKALNNTEKLILRDHLKGCVVDAFRSGNLEKVLGDLENALDKFIRSGKNGGLGQSHDPGENLRCHGLGLARHS
jgi:CsoR family transcriptional regulator, copper-sensing transcriptional repressor